MRRGFLLGKFMPPHTGHQLLCDFASAYCDELTILVCTRPCEPIEGELRYQWMKEMCPGARVLHYDQDIPQEPRDHPDFWNIWRQLVQRVHPEPIDFVFASEDYGHRLAAELLAIFVPFDPQRLAAPISATQVRSNPYAAWNFLPGPVRTHYVKTVCMLGPESSGKTTLANSLAQHFKTIAAPEYGRVYCEAFGTDCTAEDLRRIVHGHTAMENAARRQANRLLFTDTDAVMTAIWADMLLGERPSDLDESERAADLYLLTDIDFAWVNDGTRYFADPVTRKKFFALCREELVRRKLPFVLVSGTPNARFEQAVSAIHAHFPGITSV